MISEDHTRESKAICDPIPVISDPIPPPHLLTGKGGAAIHTKHGRQRSPPHKPTKDTTMTTQAQTTMTEQDLNSIHAFCDELEAYLATGMMPLHVSTWKGVVTFHVHNPVVYTHPCGDRKVACKVVSAPEDFAFLIGQHHSFSLLL